MVSVHAALRGHLDVRHLPDQVRCEQLNSIDFESLIRLFVSGFSFVRKLKFPASVAGSS